MKEIVINVSDDGEIKIETKGFSGKTCVSESQFIKDLLGRETARELTPTNWQENQTRVKKYLPICG